MFTFFVFVKYQFKCFSTYFTDSRTMLLFVLKQIVLIGSNSDSSRNSSKSGLVRYGRVVPLNYSRILSTTGASSSVLRKSLMLKVGGSAKTSGLWIILSPLITSSRLSCDTKRDLYDSRRKMLLWSLRFSLSSSAIGVYWFLYYLTRFPFSS